MIVLHAGVYDGRVLLWGETSAQSEAIRPTRRRGRRPEVSHPPSLPYDSGAKGLSVALREAGFSFPADKKRIETVIAWMPTMDNQPVASSPLIAEPPKSRAKPILTPWTVTALPLFPEQAVEVLCACVGKQTLAPGIRCVACCLDECRHWQSRHAGRVRMSTLEHFQPNTAVLHPRTFRDILPTQIASWHTVTISNPHSFGKESR